MCRLSANATAARLGQPTHTARQLHPPKAGPLQHLPLQRLPLQHLPYKACHDLLLLLQHRPNLQRRRWFGVTMKAPAGPTG